MSTKYYNPQGERIYSPIESKLRVGFVKKVYGILALQLTATALICYLSRVSIGVQLIVNTF